MKNQADKKTLLNQSYTCRGPPVGCRLPPTCSCKDLYDRVEYRKGPSIVVQSFASPPVHVLTERPVNS